MLDELRKNAQRCWMPGKWVSINEQTITYKGHYGLALQITYKREGMGISVMRCARMDTLFSFISGVVTLRSYPR